MPSPSSDAICHTQSISLTTHGHCVERRRRWQRHARADGFGRGGAATAWAAAAPSATSAPSAQLERGQAQGSVAARGSAAAVASRRDGAAAAAAAARARRARRRGGGAEGRPRRSTRAGAWRGWAEGGGGFLARTGCELERSCSSRRVRALEALSAAVARHGLTCGASFTMTGRTTPQAPSQPHDSPHELTTTLTAPPSRT